MDKYIGINIHAASCTIAVVDASGKQAGSHVVATSGQEIVECLRAIPGERHVCFEKGTPSGRYPSTQRSENLRGLRQTEMAEAAGDAGCSASLVEGG